MSWIKKRWPKLLLLLIGVVLFSTKYTDADLVDLELIRDNLLRATTLDFANKSTANERPLGTLFNVSGLLSNGFQVETVRIKREGEMNFSYELSITEKTGSPEFCDSLVITIRKNWQVVAQAPLNDLYYSDEVKSSRYQDLILTLATDGSKRGLGGQECQFQLMIQTTLDPAESNFSDQEFLQNQVTSGTF